MTYHYYPNLGKPIERLQAAIKTPAEVDFLTRDKVLHYPNSYENTGTLLLVMGIFGFTVFLHIAFQGNYDGPLTLVLGFSIMLMSILSGIFLLLLGRRKVIISGKGIKIVDFLGHSSQLDWPQIVNVGYRVWDQSLVFYLGDHGPRRAVSLYHFGIGDLVQSLRDNLKPEVYQPALFVVDYISHCVNPSRYPSCLSDAKYSRETNNQLLGGVNLGQRFWTVFSKIFGPGMIIAGIIMGIIGLNDLIIKRSQDASNLAAGLVLVGLGFSVKALSIKEVKKKIFWLVTIWVTLVFTIYILSIL